MDEKRLFKELVVASSSFFLGGLEYIYTAIIP